MTVPEPLDRARESFARQAWADAYALLSAVERETPLAPEDLERLAVAAHLTGKDEESAAAWTRAHHEHLRLGDAARAARCAFWLGFGLVNRGERARGGGWFARAGRLLDDAGLECAERGHLLLPVALRRIGEGDAGGAYATFGEAAGIGERYGDRDLVMYARHGQGRALIRMGRVAEGSALLDEVMVAVTAGEVAPIVAGDIYCSVLEACQEIFDVRRAQEWTAAMSRWCEAQPDLVPYRGQCLAYRAEIMRLRGAWRDAMEEAERARERLSEPPGQRAVGAAFYQQAELLRLRGELGEAEAAYREASRWGRSPEPGLALLRLARGQIAAAEAAIRRAVDEARGRLPRSRLLAAYVEIVLAAGDVDAARAGAAELAELAADLDAPLLRAHAARAEGAVRLAAGDARAALGPLRRAAAAWQELDAPYEAARVRVLIARACRALGDEDTAELELDAARGAFRRLGAEPDLARAEALSRKTAARAAGGLTPREVQVLRLVASGRTNRQIAAELFISEKTVARHVSNIFAKLGLSSRSAATAYAYEQGVV